ncbi:FtsX-like permease family protein [Butyrivibrio sp. CB08]|uniref:ABC transporter permease n=1 Tax=Butyrivibrio sp. CB08 TaxID=2364879 RepID=UPI000EAA00A0|nr:ABC transporter permease [Butyrivibrio sp. CB08]RKM61344.1 FtsX-like permease family protein [Butyrivibrio sp. CB08]
MGKIGEYLKSAIKQILGNGYRTAMTMLGIVIGIAAVIAVVALGNGMSAYVTNSINDLAGNYGVMSMNTSKTSERFTRDDMLLIEDSIPGIKGVSPNLSAYGKVTARKGTFECSLNGGSEALQYALSNEIVKGSYFNRQQVESGARVCIMLLDDAKKLFGTEDAVGREIDITVGGKTATYTIIGLRDHMNDMYAFIMEGQEYYCEIELPYTALCADFDFDSENFYQLVVFDDQSTLSQTVDTAKEIMTNKHGLRGTTALSAYSMADFAQELDQILGYASSFLLLVSVISLVVGGIGVMNIMLVSVTERTREIGIRKSIGASTGAILTQFLAESAILTLLGGIVGIVLGIGLAYIICTAIGFDVIITPSSVAGAALFSVLIGLFFGIYPARKAALMKPIDALRL